MSDYLEDALRTLIFRTGAGFAKTTHLYVSLHTANPTDAGTGTEVSGGSYARVDVPPLDANWSAGTATDGNTKNVSDIVFPAPSANWGTITHFGIWDALTSGNLICYGALGTSKTVNNGDPAPKFSANALSITFQ